MNNLPQSFVLFGLSIFIWAISAFVSSNFVDNAQNNKNKQNSSMSVAATDPEITRLLEHLKSNPNDTTVKLKLASVYEKVAKKSNNGSLLMEAAQQYSTALSIEPKNANLMLAYAKFCLRYGIIDKAKELYGKYIKVKPDDLNSKVDYALSIFQSGETEKSKKVINSIINDKPKYFGAHLALLFVYAQSGELNKAKKEAKIATKYAPDEDARSRISKIMTSVKVNKNMEAKDAQSPAFIISEYMKSNPVLGPKLKHIRWPTVNTARIELDNFPVNKMLENMKKMFIQKLKSSLAKLPEEVKIEFFDLSKNKTQLSINVGTKSSS